MLSPRNPVPVYTGLLERIYQVAKNVGERHDVTVLYPDEPSRRDERGRVPSRQPFEVAGLKNLVIEKLDTLVPHYSTFRGIYKTHPWLYRPLRRYLTEHRPDVMLVEMPFLAPIALVASRGFDVPVVLSEHNVEYKLARRLNIPGAKLLEVFEVGVCNRVDNVVTVSDTDRETLREKVETPIDIAPNGVDVERYRQDRRSETLRDCYGDGPLLMYHGNLGNAQNAEAVEQLVEELFPRIRKRQSDARLLLVGANPPRVDREGITVTGLVDDLPKYVASADVAVVPLRSGSGTKLKILEYLASGTPVVTTPVGAEGLPLVDGENALIAGTVQGLLGSVERVLSNEPLADRLAESGRALTEERFAWSETLSPYQELLEGTG